MDSSLLPAEFFERSLDLLTRLVSEGSASGDAAGLERMAALLSAELSARGLETAVQRALGEGGVPLPFVEAWSAQRDRPPLLLLGHFDTVLGAATPRREADRLIATGAIDMKGGLAAFCGALDLLRSRGLSPPDLRLVVVPDEEVSGIVSTWAVETFGREARALWVLEPGEPIGNGAETLVAGRRGMFHWRLRAEGRAAHAGLAFWDGRSAVAAAAEWCARAAGLAQRKGGPIVNLSRILGGGRAFVEQLAEQAGIFGSLRELNVVPDRADVEGEARFLSRAEGEEIAAGLARAAAEIAAAREVRIEWQRDRGISPVAPGPAGRPWLERAVELARHRGWRLEVETDRGGISFPNFLPDPDRLPVLDGLGPVGGGMHTREEFVDLRSFARRVVLLADLLAAEAAAGSSA